MGARRKEGIAIRRGASNRGWGAKQGLGRKGQGDFALYVKIDPSPKALGAAFDKASDAAKDWRPAFRLAIGPMADSLGENIRTQGGSIGKSWSGGPGTDDYRARRRKKGKGFSGVPLVRTGRLLRAVTRHKARSLTKRQVSVGVRGKIALYAVGVNFGVTSRRTKHGVSNKGASAHPFMAWSGRASARVQRILDDHARRIVESIARETQSAGRAARRAA